MCPHFVAIWIVFSIPLPFFVSYSYRVAHGPRPHSPPLRGEILAPTATDVLRNGVHSPGIHSGGPTSIFAGFRSRRSWSARSFLGSSYFRMLRRSCVAAYGRVLRPRFRGFTFLGLAVNPSKRMLGRVLSLVSQGSSSAVVSGVSGVVVGFSIIAAPALPSLIRCVRLRTLLCRWPRSGFWAARSVCRSSSNFLHFRQV